MSLYTIGMTYIDRDGKHLQVRGVHHGLLVSPLGYEGEETTHYSYLDFEDRVMVRTMVPETLKAQWPEYLSKIHTEALDYAHSEALLENRLRESIKDETALSAALEAAHRFATESYNRAYETSKTRFYEQGVQDTITSSGVEDWDYER